jgi:4-alpha-glucanotransferase
VVDPHVWGIDTGYHDLWGNWHEAPASTLDAISETMQAEQGLPPPSPVVFVRRGETASLGAPGEIHLEDGGFVPVGDRLPPDLPYGYHRIVVGDGPARRLIVTPGRCYLPDGLREWGWAASAYALRSHTSWGMGDLGDLRRLAEWSARRGAGMLLINPLHAADPHPAEPSPYSPGSRCWRNPLYLKVEEVPGAAHAGLDLDGLAKKGRALSSLRHIDRAAVFELKSAALELLWERFSGDDDFDRYCEDHGQLLDDFATFVVLAEIHGPDRHAWAQELRHPRSAAVARVRRERAARVDYHKWLQWLLERQLTDASQHLRLINDLAIGVGHGGADAWIWQDVFASGMTIGAPPDDFNLSGQNWGVLPFDPWNLQAAEYEPFIALIRSALRNAGGLRYDHVMGLFRLFWIPEGASAADGTYVRYPFGDLLDIIALESHRAGGVIVGEDLGTVEPYVREELARRAVLSYRLMWFEPSPPTDYPEHALAAVTNHDLPTIPGVWTGADLRDQKRAGVRPNYEFADAVRAKLTAAAGGTEGDAVEEVVAGAYRALAGAPSALLAATLEDAFGVTERPNLPGTVSEHPNWSLALPYTLEEIDDHPGPLRLSEILSERST